MSDFINSLREEHTAIKESLNKIGSMDLSSKEARVRLADIREVFVKHLQKEDEEMYPKLKELALSDEQLKSILQYMEEEIKLITQFVLIFFDKYSKKTKQAGFDREFSLICSTLIKRIEKEEELFFPEFEKRSG
jgi:iron-sulfur cluster repair protein YtfE (RIC family)